MRRAAALGLLLARASAACPSCAAQSDRSGTLTLVFVMMGVPVVVLVVFGLIIRRFVPPVTWTTDAAKPPSDGGGGVSMV